MRYNNIVMAASIAVTAISFLSFQVSA